MRSEDLRKSLAALAIAALAIAACAAGSIASAQTSDYELRRFKNGPGWFVYDGDVDVALHVLDPDDPECHEIGEIVLLFENRDQLRDTQLIETAALTGMNRYAELCRALGATPSNQRKVVGVIAGETEPDERGRIMGEARVIDAMVSSLTGDYQFTVRRNTAATENQNSGAAAIIAKRDEELAARQAE